MSVPQPGWRLNPKWGSLPRATSCCRGWCTSLPRPCWAPCLQPSAWAQSLLIRLGGAGCSGHPAAEPAIRSSIARLHNRGDSSGTTRPGRALPSSSANSGVSSLHSSPSSLPQSPAGFQGGLWSRRLWLCWMQVFAARVNPSPPKTSFPPGSVELQGSCCPARITRFFLELEKPQWLHSARPSRGRILPGAERKVWSREMPRRRRERVLRAAPGGRGG